MKAFQNFRVDLKRLKTWHVPALVFVVFATAFQPVFAMADAEQKLLGNSSALGLPSLVGDILELVDNLGDFQVDDGGLITITRPDGVVITVDNAEVVRGREAKDNSLAADIAVFDPTGKALHSVHVNRAFASDTNTVHIEANVILEDTDVPVTALLAGGSYLTGRLNLAEDNREPRGVTEVFEVDFSRLNASSETPFVDAIVITDADGGTRIEPISLILATVIVFVVVLFVAVTCLAFGWWGCD